MASVDERIAELTRAMLRKKLYVILTHAHASPEALKPHLPAHLEYMIGLEKSGMLFASGPFAEADGSQRGNGMSIVRARSADEARQIAEGDPFFVAGLRTFDVREWTVMEGSVGVTVNFSDRSLALA
jgi:uncharacterized protein